MTRVELIGDSARGSDYASVRLVLEGDRIVESDARGLARDLVGLTLLEAAAVPGETLPTDALANAIGPAFGASPAAGRVVVALSGGVDSAVALLRAGRLALGVTLRLWLDPHGPRADRTCCSPAAVLAARATCHSRGLPHVTLDLREAFRREVVKPFVEGYASGLTPNPCSRCNGRFRFRELIEFAARAGADELWTGHYARIVERHGRLLLARGVDARKDQSYMLATLDPALLASIRFPLGHQVKEAVRDEARAARLSAASRPESQEACFLAGGDYRSFLERNGLASEDGAIVDERGHELGRHEGTWRYTVGQRRGIGIAAPAPLYALRSDRATNTLVVGPKEALEIRTVEVTGRLHAPIDRADAVLQYRSGAIPATVEATVDGFVLHLDRPAYAVAAGQVAVLYEGDAVVGAGSIEAATG